MENPALDASHLYKNPNAFRKYTLDSSVSKGFWLRTDARESEAESGYNKEADYERLTWSMKYCAFPGCPTSSVTHSRHLALISSSVTSRGFGIALVLVAKVVNFIHGTPLRLLKCSSERVGNQRQSTFK